MTQTWIEAFADSYCEGSRDAVTESSSASDLLPVATKAKPPVPREAQTIGPDEPHAFRGGNVAACALCGKPAIAEIHRAKSGKRAFDPNEPRLHGKWTHGADVKTEIKSVGPSFGGQHGEFEIRPPSSTGYQSGQTDLLVSAHDKSGKQVGHLTYSRTRDENGKEELHIQHIETSPEARGKGLATAMWKVMRVNHVGAKVDPGMFTDEGSKWWKSAGMKSLQGIRPDDKRAFDSGPDDPILAPHKTGTIHAMRNKQKAAFNSDADQVEPQFHSVMSKLFDQQKSATLSRLKGNRGRRMIRATQPPEGSDEPAGPVDASSVFDSAHWAAKTAEIAAPIYNAAAALSRNRVRNQLGDAVTGADETSSLASVTDILKTRANRMAGDVTDTTFGQITDQLAQGTQAGENMNQLASRVSGVFDAAKSRATMIARTETIGALNQAANSYAENLPSGIVGRKQWAAHHDDRTRPTHRMADGQEVPLTQNFRVGASTMAFPGDPTAPPNEVCNCRCSLFYLPAATALTKGLAA